LKLKDEGFVTYDDNKRLMIVEEFVHIA